MQCLAEDRWEDYEWRHDGERYAYWHDGFSWIEKPELDPLGVGAREYLKTMSTIPDRSSDLSFYLTNTRPLPKGVIAPLPHVNGQNQHIERDVIAAQPGLLDRNGVDVDRRKGQGGGQESHLEIGSCKSGIVVPV